jgi:hypothetical protein
VTDAQAGPSTGDYHVETQIGMSGQAATTSADTDANLRPALVAISLLGVLLTGLCLAMVDKLDHSASGRVLAGAAVVTALIAVVVAIGGHLSTLLRGTAAKRAARLGVLVAGVLSMLAVLLAAVAVMFAVQSHVPGALGASTEPTIVVQRTGTADGRTAVTAQLTFPGLPAGAVLNAEMLAFDDEDAGNVVAHSAVRVGEGGPAVVALSASADPNDRVVIEALTPDRRCSVNLPAPASDEGSVTQVSCTAR